MRQISTWEDFRANVLKSTLDGLLLQLLLSSLREYILKQLFFSISVNIVAEYLTRRFVAR